MKFQILSFGENSEAKFIKAQVFTAPSKGRASAAGVAAASPPHACCLEETYSAGLKYHRGEQCPVTELMFLSNSTVPLAPPPPDVTSNWKWAGWIRVQRQQNRRWFQRHIGTQCCLSPCITQREITRQRLTEMNLTSLSRNTKNTNESLSLYQNLDILLLITRLEILTVYNMA